MTNKKPYTTEQINQINTYGEHQHYRACQDSELVSFEEWISDDSLIENEDISFGMKALFFVAFMSLASLLTLILLAIWLNISNTFLLKCFITSGIFFVVSISCVKIFHED